MKGAGRVSTSREEAMSPSGTIFLERTHAAPR